MNKFRSNYLVISIGLFAILFLLAITFVSADYIFLPITEFKPQNAALAAALISGFFSILIFIFTSLSSYEVAKRNQFNEERKEARKRIKDMVEIIGKVERSLSLMVESSFSVDRSSEESRRNFKHKTIDTLSIVSELFRATEEDKTIDLPDIISSSCKKIRAGVTDLFLGSS